MPWAFVQDTPDATLDEYDRVTAELGDEAPEGLIVHVAGPHGSGFRIMDVWESEEAFMRFRDQRLGPAIVKVIGPEAMEGPPLIDPIDVHHIIRG